MPQTSRTKVEPYAGRANRGAILEAALNTFACFGFEGASTRMIAAAAGIEQGHLSYYFKSKESLWFAVIESFARGPEAFLRDALSASALADPVTTARSVLPTLLRMFAERPQLTRVMLQEFSVSSSRHEWLVESFGRPIWRLIRPLFEGLAAEGLLAGAPPPIAYFNLIGGALVGFGNPGVMKMIANVDPEDPAVLRQHIQLLLQPIFQRADERH